MDIQTLFFTVFKYIKGIMTTEEIKVFVNAKDSEGNSAILYASFKGNFDIIIELINSGADVSARNKMGLSVLHMAAQGDRPHLLIYFKEKYGFDILDKDDAGNTPLHWACHTTAEKSITFLLCWMDDINIQDNRGHTPLHIALLSFRPKIIKKLLLKGADINLKDHSGQSVLSIVSVNKDQRPEYDDILHLITDNKPMKFCFLNQKNSNIFNSLFFVLIHLFCEPIVFFILIPTIGGGIYSIIFLILLVTLTFLFILVSFSDPGRLICNDTRTWLELVEEKVYISDYCPYCKVQKTILVKHCHICHICVNEFDHHCNWIDNCVGEKNWGKFNLFLVVVLVNLCFCYYIGLLVFITKKDIVANDTFFNIFGFSLVLRLNARCNISLFIMTITLFFIVPVLYLIWIQLKRRLFDNKKAGDINGKKIS